MENNGETVEVTTKVELPTVHKAGKFVVSGAAAFIADQLASAAYDKVLAIYRSRKSR